MVQRWCVEGVGGISSKISSRMRPDALTPFFRVESLGDLRRGDASPLSSSSSSIDSWWFAAMFFSDAVIIDPSSSVSIIVGGGEDWSWVWE